MNRFLLDYFSVFPASSSRGAPEQRRSAGLQAGDGAPLSGLRAPR